MTGTGSRESHVEDGAGWDPRLVDALAVELGHGPPFAHEELAALDALDVSHARDLEGLRSCPAVEVLALIGCDATSWAPLSALHGLRWLRVDCSNLADLTPLRALDLVRVRLRGCRVSDLEPLSGAGLQHLDVRGNPLSHRSADEVVPMLLAREVELQVDEPAVIAVNRSLAEADVPFALYGDGGATWLCPVGLSTTAQPEMAHAPVEPDEVERALAGDGSVPDLYHARRPRSPAFDGRRSEG